MYLRNRFKLEDPLNSRGFTLIELITVMVIIGIAAAIAVPSFRGFTNSTNATTAVNDLVSALNLARSEAVTRGRNVTVCKSANQTGCTTSGNWEQGWIVFVDVDGDATVDSDDTLLRVYSAPKGSTTMVGNANVDDRITYAPTGFFNAVFNGTITVTSGAKIIRILTNSTGRIRTESP